MMFLQPYLIADDLLADQIASSVAYYDRLQDLEQRISTLEEKFGTASK